MMIAAILREKGNEVAFVAPDMRVADIVQELTN